MTPRRGVLPYHVIHEIEDALAALNSSDRWLAKVDVSLLQATEWGRIAEARRDLKDAQLHLLKARFGKREEDSDGGQRG